MKEIVVGVPDGKRAEWVNGMLTLVDDVEAKKDDRPVTDRVRIFEDALNELGEEHVAVKDYWSMFHTGIEFSNDIIAYFKLRVIAAALNEGWEPSFDNEEYRWYPWFTMWTEEELAYKSDEWKKDHNLWLFGGHSSSGSYCGLACAYSNCDWSHSYANSSARLAVKSEGLAIYFGNQFIQIWADYVGPFYLKNGKVC